MDNISIAIPKTIQNLQLPDPSLTLYYQNLQKRIIWLETEIDESCLDLIKYILQWNKEDEGIPQEDRKPIKIIFFSPGGDLDINNALIDTITISKTPVYGYNMGRCYSAAAYIFLSCHKRFTLPNSQFMLHQGSSALQGTYQEILPQVIAYQEQIGKLAKFVSTRTGYDMEAIEQNIISDWYIDVEEGLEYHVYDDIIHDLGELI